MHTTEDEQADEIIKEEAPAPKDMIQKGEVDLLQEQFALMPTNIEIKTKFIEDL